MNFFLEEHNLKKSLCIILVLIGVLNVLKGTLLSNYNAVIHIFVTLVGFSLLILMSEKKSLKFFAVESTILSFYILVLFLSFTDSLLYIFSSGLMIYIIMSLLYLCLRYNVNILKSVYYILLFSTLCMAYIYWINGIFLPPHFDYLTTLSGSINRNVTKEIIAFPLFSYYLLIKANGEKVDRVLPVVASLILILSNSRVGIVLGGIGLACYLLLLIRDGRKVTLLGISIFVLFLLSYNIDLFGDKLKGLFWAFDRLESNAVVRDPRSDVINCYIESFSPYKLFFGLHFGGDDICAWKAGVGEPNTHNSFINGYTNFGVLFVLFMGFIFSKSLASLFRNFDLVFVFCSIGLLLTSYFERNMFPSYFDPIVLLSIFYYLKSTERG